MCLDADGNAYGNLKGKIAGNEGFQIDDCKRWCEAFSSYGYVGLNFKPLDACLCLYTNDQPASSGCPSDEHSEKVSGYSFECEGDWSLRGNGAIQNSEWEAGWKCIPLEGYSSETSHRRLDMVSLRIWLFVMLLSLAIQLIFPALPM